MGSCKIDNSLNPEAESDLGRLTNGKIIRAVGPILDLGRVCISGIFSAVKSTQGVVVKGCKVVKSCKKVVKVVKGCKIEW